MTKISIRVASLVSAAVLAASISPASASEPFPCFEPHEVRSVQIHDLRIMMMVGALQCRDIAPGALRIYGDFVTSRDADLTAHADTIESGMVDAYGGRIGRLAFDDYETMLSNYYSAFRPSRSSCAELGATARMALDADDRELEMLGKLATNRAVAVCYGPDKIAAAELSDQPAHVRVIRGMVPPQIASAANDAEMSADKRLNPEPIVSAPVVPLKAEYEDDRVAIAEAPTEATSTSAAQQRLDRAIEALDSAAAALRELAGDDPVAQ